MHQYKEEKETPFNFQDGICDRAPKLMYVRGQEVVSYIFIFSTYHAYSSFRSQNAECQRKYPEYQCKSTCLF